jgi:hypothetical protein
MERPDDVIPIPHGERDLVRLGARSRLWDAGRFA